MLYGFLFRGQSRPVQMTDFLHFKEFTHCSNKMSSGIGAHDNKMITNSSTVRPSDIIPVQNMANSLLTLLPENSYWTLRSQTEFKNCLLSVETETLTPSACSFSLKLWCLLVLRHHSLLRLCRTELVSK